MTYSEVEVEANELNNEMSSMDVHVEGRQSCDESLLEGCCMATLRRTFSKGILFAFAGVLILTAADMCMSILTEKVDPLLVVAHFSPLIASTSFALIFTLKLSPPSGKRVVALLALYGASISVATNCISGSIGRMPVADAISILYCAPVFAAIFGCLFLKQLLRVIDCLLIAICIGGVLLIARPSFLFQNTATRSDVEILGISMAVGGAFFYALSLIFVCKLSIEGVHRLWMIGTGTTFIFIVNVVLCFIFEKWALPDPLYYLLIVVLYAACGFSAQLCIYTALNSERAVNVSVILTFEIALLYLLQIFLLKVNSTWLTLVGALLVTVSCIGMALRRKDDNNGAE